MVLKCVLHFVHLATIFYLYKMSRPVTGFWLYRKCFIIYTYAWFFSFFNFKTIFLFIKRQNYFFLTIHLNLVTNLFSTYAIIIYACKNYLFFHGFINAILPITTKKSLFVVENNLGTCTKIPPPKKKYSLVFLKHCLLRIQYKI